MGGECFTSEGTALDALFSTDASFPLEVGFATLTSRCGFSRFDGAEAEAGAVHAD